MGKRALSSATQSGIACSETNATVDVVPDPHEISIQGWILALILQILLSSVAHRSAIAADTLADSRRSLWALHKFFCFDGFLLVWGFFLFFF